MKHWLDSTNETAARQGNRCAPQRLPPAVDSPVCLRQTDSYVRGDSERLSCLPEPSEIHTEHPVEDRWPSRLLIIKGCFMQY